MPGGRGAWSEPLGPFTVTAPAATLTVTPLGRVIGLRPMRDIGCLPDVAEDLAAHAGLGGGATGHETLRSRKDVDAEAAVDPGNPVLAAVDAAARLADSLEVGD